jgi:hypothetical protein
MTSSELGVFFIPDCVETELCPLSPTVVAIFMFVKREHFRSNPLKITANLGEYSARGLLNQTLH